MTASRPFDDIRDLLRKMPKADEGARAAAREREGQLTKPAGSLGRLEEIAEWMAAWQGSARPHVDRPLVAVFAGNHGVVAQGVSAFPPSVTEAMVANFRAGGAAINQICTTFDISLKVYELALEKPTGTSPRNRRSMRRLARRQWPSAWRRSPPSPICSCSAKWASAIRRRRPPSITRFTAARRRIGSAAGPASMTTA